MQDKVKDLSNQTIRQVYKKHDGKELTSINDSIVIDNDYIIMTCSNLSLVKKYISPNKRTYILLDKSISSRDYSSAENESVWYIPTDLKLPNLLIADQSIYHVPFNLSQSNKNIFDDINGYLIYLIQKYVKKAKEIEVDVLDPELKQVILHNGEVDCFKNSSAIISDNYSYSSIISSKLRKDLNINYTVLDTPYINYLDIIRDGKLNTIIIDNNLFVELCIQFDFNQNSYKHKEVFNTISYNQAYQDKYYNFSDELITIKDEIIENIDIKVDLIRKNDEKYIMSEANKLLNQSSNKEYALKQVFKFHVIEMKLSDFDNHKKLNNKEVEELIKQQLEDDVDIYKTKQGFEIGRAHV